MLMAQVIIPIYFSAPRAVVNFILYIKNLLKSSKARGTVSQNRAVCFCAFKRREELFLKIEQFASAL
jgi:hypothetical protein